MSGEKGLKKLSLNDQKKIWKGEEISLGGIVSGYFDIDKQQVNQWDKAIRFVVGSNIHTLARFALLVKAANDSACKAEMNNRLVGADTEEDVKSITVDFIHQKTTKQHEEGTFKTSILPNSWRTAVSVIGTALAHKISLVHPVLKNGVIVGYTPAKKSTLDRLIKEVKAKANPTEETPEGTEETPEVLNLDSENKGAIERLEIVVNAMRHILAEIDDEAEVAMAQKMVSTVWDLTPMKIAAEA